MTHPSVNSIVERLQFDAARCELQFSKGVAENISEAATIISELQAENERKDRLIEAHRQQIVDAGEIMDHWQALALIAESSLSRIKEETIEECARVAEDYASFRPIPEKSSDSSLALAIASISNEACKGVASAIRSLGSTGGAEAEEGSPQKEGSR